MGRLALLASLLAAAFVAACSGAHKQPTGPAPEYEDAPPPSWLKEAGAPQPSATDGGVS